MPDKYNAEKTNKKVYTN